MRLKDRVAIVTGGGQGIGKAVAIAFAKEGAKVTVSGRTLDTLQAVTREIETVGSKALPVRADVSKKQDVQNMVEITVREFGRIDILVNNAGFTRPAMLHKMTEEDWDAVINVHLKGTFLCTQAVAPYMMEQKYGKIINVVSRAGIQGTIGQVNYSAAKGGIIALTKSSARELARYSINVNAIAPGAATQMTEKIRTDPKISQVYLSQMLLGRWADTEEIAPAFVFLASDDGNYITAQIYCVDGGLTVS
ncbi:MAG: glucose 1-dehydrogenase [Chloroflexi bacterium]|nr:glucose 1-dehydrogenase [Chloroflexota bacterium]